MNDVELGRSAGGRLDLTLVDVTGTVQIGGRHRHRHQRVQGIGVAALQRLVQTAQIAIGVAVGRDALVDLEDADGVPG